MITVMTSIHTPHFCFWYFIFVYCICMSAAFIWHNNNKRVMQCHCGWSHTTHREIAGSTSARALLCYNLGRVVYTLIPLSPSSISRYQCKKTS